MNIQDLEEALDWVLKTVVEPTPLGNKHSFYQHVWDRHTREFGLFGIDPPPHLATILEASRQRVLASQSDGGADNG